MFELTNVNSKISNNLAQRTQLNQAAQSVKYRLDVQGLRAVAVISVILFHANKDWLPAGFLGVDVFFVISGFIITSLITGGGGRFSWGDFYWGRAKRIVPAYAAMLLVVSLAAAVFFIPADFAYFQSSLKSALSFTSNNYFSNFGSYFAPGAHELPLLHTWSLAIEMQFYLLLPLFLVLTPVRWLVVTLLMLFVLLSAHAEWQLWVTDNQRHVYFSLLARVPEFLLGAMVAVGRTTLEFRPTFRNFLGSTGLVLLLLCFYFIDTKHFPGVMAILPCLATAMIISARTGPVNTWLSTPVLVWLGTISYSLYLWHWPILALLRYSSGGYDLNYLEFLIFVVATFFLATLSYYCVETPLRKGGKGATGVVLLTASTLIAVLVLAPYLNKAIEKPLLPEMTRYAPGDQVCHGQLVLDCKRGDLTKPVSTLVLGDSHAAQLNYFFDAAGNADGFSVRVITASNCVPIPGFDVDRIPDYSRAACRAQIDALAPYIEGASTVIVAGMWQWQAQSEEFLKALSAFLEKLTANGKQVIVLAQIPMFEVNVQRMQRFTALGVMIRPEQNPSWKQANETISRLVSRVRNVQFLDFSSSPFFSQAPFENGQLIYLDNHHLNEVGARRYGEFAAPTLAELLSPQH